MGRRQLRVVVDPDRVLAVAARRLDRDEHVAELQPARSTKSLAVERTVPRAAVPTRSSIAGGAAARQRRVPLEVLARRAAAAARPASCSSVRNSGSCPPAAISACISSSPCGEVVLHLHPIRAQRVEQVQRARRRVEPHGHPDPRVLGRELVSSIATRALGGRIARSRAWRTASRATRAQRSRSGDIARHRHADRRALRVALLERDHAAEQAPVELRDRDLGGGVERRRARSPTPPRPRAKRSRRPPGSPARRAPRAPGVPLLPVLATPSRHHQRGVRGPRAARREHRRRPARRPARRAARARAPARRGRGAACSSRPPARSPPPPRSPRTARRRTRCSRSAGASGRSTPRPSGAQGRGG